MLASDGYRSYALICYKKLTVEGEVGFSENSCNWKKINMTRSELLEQKQVVFNLTKYSCIKANHSGNKFIFPDLLLHWSKPEY